MERLKIGFVLDDSLDRPDGVQQYVLTLSAWLTRHGHEVHLITGETKRQDLQNVHSLSRNVNIRFNKNRLSIPLPVRKNVIKHLLEVHQFNVIHVQMPYSPWLAERIIKAVPLPTAVIGTFHIAPYSSAVSTANRLLSRYEHGSLQRFDKILSVSATAQTFATRVFKLESEVIPNAIDLKPYQSATPLKKYDDGTLNIVFLGRLVPRKGCHYLLEAVRLLRQQYKKPFRVIIGGSGPLEAELKAFVNKHELHKVVKFEGFIDEKEKAHYLASADIAIFPSLGGESFGIVLLEAMAVARGVVLAGDNPGYRSVIDGQSGQLFKPTNTPELAAKLLHFLNDTSARNTAHAWQKQHVQQFNIEIIGPLIETIYKQALHPQRDMR